MTKPERPDARRMVLGGLAVSLVLTFVIAGLWLARAKGPAPNRENPTTTAPASASAEPAHASAPTPIRSATRHEVPDDASGKRFVAVCDDDPIPDVVVHYAAPGQLRGAVTTDADGSFVLSGHGPWYVDLASPPHLPLERVLTRAHDGWFRCERMGSIDVVVAGLDIRRGRALQVSIRPFAPDPDDFLPEGSHVVADYGETLAHLAKTGRSLADESTEAAVARLPSDGPDVRTRVTAIVDAGFAAGTLRSRRLYDAIHRRTSAVATHSIVAATGSVNLRFEGLVPGQWIVAATGDVRVDFGAHHRRDQNRAVFGLGSPSETAPIAIRHRENVHVAARVVGTGDLVFALPDDAPNYANVWIDAGDGELLGVAKPWAKGGERSYRVAALPAGPVTVRAHWSRLGDIFFVRSAQTIVDAEVTDAGVLRPSASRVRVNVRLVDTAGANVDVDTTFGPAFAAPIFWTATVDAPPLFQKLSMPSPFTRGPTLHGADVVTGRLALTLEASRWAAAGKVPITLVAPSEPLDFGGARGDLQFTIRVDTRAVTRVIGRGPGLTSGQTMYLVVATAGGPTIVHQRVVEGPDGTRIVWPVAVAPGEYRCVVVPGAPGFRRVADDAFARCAEFTARFGESDAVTATLDAGITVDGVVSSTSAIDSLRIAAVDVGGAVVEPQAWMLRVDRDGRFRLAGVRDGWRIAFTMPNSDVRTDWFTVAPGARFAVSIGSPRRRR